MSLQLYFLVNFSNLTCVCHFGILTVVRSLPSPGTTERANFVISYTNVLRIGLIRGANHTGENSEFCTRGENTRFVFTPKIADHLY